MIFFVRTIHGIEILNVLILAGMVLCRMDGSVVAWEN